MTEEQPISKVTDIINDSKIGMLTTVNEEGALVSRPLAVQEVQDDGDMWFFTGLGTSQVAHVRQDPRVNVSFGKSTEWVSVAGTAHVVTDRQKIHEMWNQVVEAWFPDGPDTPEVCLIHVDSDSAEYWTSPGGTAATVLQWSSPRSSTPASAWAKAAQWNYDPPWLTSSGFGSFWRRKGVANSNCSRRCEATSVR